MNESMTYWQEVFKLPAPGFEPLMSWQSVMDQSCTQWSSLWQQWQQALEQWLTNWSDLCGYTLQSNPPFGMLFPPLEDLSCLNQTLIQVMQQSTESMLTGFGVLSPGRAAELTDQVTQLETAIGAIHQHLKTLTAQLETSTASDAQSELTAHTSQLEAAMASVNHHIEQLTERLATSDSAITQQVGALQDQMQTTHEATTQQLTTLAQRLDEVTAPPKRPSPRSTTRRKPTS